MNHAPRCIIITGFMGAGKTTIAQALAERLGRCSLDLDALITKREGRTPQQMIDRDGEARFRVAETRALRAALASAGPSVIALGGGAWTITENRALSQARGAYAIWLDAPFALCWERIKHAPADRPLARREAATRRLYNERRAYYQLADLRVELSAGKSADAIVMEIVDALC